MDQKKSKKKIISTASLLNKANQMQLVLIRRRGNVYSVLVVCADSFAL